jgi:glycosyltransferase involved in cell wall biosynthesis
MRTLKVTLSLGSQAFQKHVATTLARRGMLARALSFGLDAEIFDPDSGGELRLTRRYSHYRLGNRVLWAAWRRLPFTDRYQHFPIVLTTPYVDWLLSRALPECDVFHGWTGVSLAGLRAAKRQRAATMIENPSMHPRDWQRAVLRECDTWGVRPHQCRSVLPEPLIRRMEEEFSIADFIVVPSAIAAKSFERAGFHGKALVVHAATDHALFKPLCSGQRNGKFTVCYAGRVELAKGVIYLLKAWKQLSLRNAELVIVGDVAAEMTGLIREYGSASVRFEGYLPAERLVDIYRDSDLFAFPSVNEGLARVLLEAMATGLPVVATDCSGADDCVTPGVDGTVTPARDADALATALMWHYENREATKVMGRAARAKIESHFTIAQYEERMMCTYGLVAEGR